MTVEEPRFTLRIGRRLEDRLEAAAPALEAEAARITTVQVLAVMGIGMGALIAATTSPGPSLRLLTAVPGWPWAWGTLLAVLGAALLVGGRHGYVLSRWVCTAMAGWYFAFGLNFAATWALWVHDTGGHPVLPAPAPNVYPVAVYLGLGMLHLTQSTVLARRVRRPHAPITPPLGIPVVQVPEPPAVSRGG